MTEEIQALQLGFVSTGRVKASLRLNREYQRVVSNAVFFLGLSTPTGSAPVRLGSILCFVHTSHFGMQITDLWLPSKDVEEEYMEKGNNQFKKIIC